MDRDPTFRLKRALALWLTACAGFLAHMPAHGAILWSHPQKILVCSNWPGEDILHGAVKPRDDTSSGTLYFKFRVDPLSDVTCESVGRKFYLAGLVLFQAGVEKLGVGNAWDAWGYSAFSPEFRHPSNKPGEYTLATDRQELDPTFTYEAPRSGTERTIVMKVEYVPHGPDEVTVWLNPILGPGASESSQYTNIVTRFQVDASFDQVRLCHRGAGDGWVFSEIAIATSFADFIPIPYWNRPWVIVLAVLCSTLAIAGAVMFIERHRAGRQIQRLERERAIERERARIAQDLHDDLGMRLTEIALLGDLGSANGSQPEHLADSLRKVAEIAREATETADGIVWAVNPRNDSLHFLGNYLVQFAENAFRLTSIRCRLDVPVELPAVPLSTPFRQHMLMAVKEACHNVIRHSGAGEVWLRLAVAEGDLEINIEDNGCGFVRATAAGVGNGLRNLQERMGEVGGRAEIFSQPGQGTRVRLIAPLPASV
jgi:signal transduction histidine kinase